jgi:hypothetical protein
MSENPPAGRAGKTAKPASRTGRYLKYAIGEIALVVIGILIALSINNWNEFRKDRIQEQVILEQLKEEYESNLKQLESKIIMRNIVIESSRKLLSYIDSPESVISDSILYNLARGGLRPTYDPIKNDLVSSNKLSLIQNNKLRKLLSQWESNYHQLNEEEWFWRDYTISTRTPFISDNKLTRKLYYTTNKINKKLYLIEDSNYDRHLFDDTTKEINFHEILMHPKLEAIASTAIFACTDANLQSFALKKNIVEILELINESLNDQILPEN